MALVVVKKRYIYALGEVSYEVTYGATPDETLYKLDTLRLQDGWSKMAMKGSAKLQFSGCQYGTIPLSNVYDKDGTDESHILIFGGISKYSQDKSNSACILKVDNNDFSKCRVEPLYKGDLLSSLTLESPALSRTLSK